MKSLDFFAPAFALCLPLAACDQGSSSGPSTASGGSSNAGATASGGTAGAASGGVGGAVSATVTISGESPKPVAATFFGQNYWSWVKAWGNPVAAVESQTKELGIQLLRAGGANNDQQAPEPFTEAEIDGFIAYAQSIGAEPLLQVPVLKNVAGEPATAEDAAAMVRYVNQTKQYGVRYFSIGNEPDLYEEQGHVAAGYNASAFCKTFASFASAMKAVDPNIVILGPDLSWKYQGGNDWLTPFLQECGSSVDVVAVHRYPLAPTACTEAAAYADAAPFRQIISSLRQIMKNTGQGEKPLALTEANITWDGEPAKSILPASPGTFPAALWLADSLGVALEEQLFSTNYWSLAEGWTLGFYDGTKPRPASHVLKLFSQHFGSAALHVTGAPAGSSVYAGRDVDAGRTSVFVVNKSASQLDLDIALADLPTTGSKTLSSPPRSLTVGQYPDDGSAPTLTVYTADMAEPGSP